MRRFDGALLGVGVALLAWSSPALAREGDVPGVFEPPADTEVADPSLAPGTILVELVDGDGHPVAGEVVTLGILINSVAKGDSRKHVAVTTDERGRALFSGLETSSNIAYRVSSAFQGGAFAATPFQLEQGKAMHVTMHVYPVARDVLRTLVISEATVAAELREDRLQLEEVLTFYNLGRVAWQPENLRLALPKGFTALSAQASMTDQGVDPIPDGALLRGTYTPGRHVVDFRWQLPLSSGDKDVEFGLGLPPHVAGARVVMPAMAGVKLSVEGFHPAELRHDSRGERFLVAERRMRPEDPKLTALTIAIQDLPTPGPGRWVALLIAACGVATGLAFSFSRPPSRATGDGKVRANLLDELEALERAHRAGDVGPKTYESARKRLVDALARTFAEPGTA